MFKNQLTADLVNRLIDLLVHTTYFEKKAEKDANEDEEDKANNEDNQDLQQLG